MLNFNSATKSLIIVLIVQFLFLHYFEQSLWLLSIPITIYILLLTYGSISIQSNFYVNVLSKAKTKKKQIAITFDDGPDKRNTKNILDVLDKYKIEAAFFVVGEKLENNAELITREYLDGHIIGNHSYSHSNYFSLYSSKKMMGEIKKTDNKIFQLINKKPLLFRPPFGVTNPTIRKAMRNFNHYIIGWNLRSFDTVSKNNEKLISRLNKNLVPGSIALFHDTTEDIHLILDAFIEAVLNSGYQIVRLDKLLKITAYE